MEKSKLGTKLWLIWCWKRALLHFPVGVGTILVSHYAPEGMEGAIILALVAGFVVYEIMEAMSLRDQAFKDIQGWLAGLFAGAVVVAFL